MTRRSEEELLEWIRAQSQSLPPTVRLGIGDDAAVFESGSARMWVVSTDLLVEGVHFERAWQHPRLLGRKALRVNLSDLAAMGALPFGTLLTAALPSELTGNYFEELLGGFLQEARNWQAPLLGGDLSRSPLLHLGVTCWGYLEEGQPLSRGGAQAGDLLLLFGEIGLSGRGLQLIRKRRGEGLALLQDEEELRAWAGDAFSYRCLLAHLLPEPRLRAGSWLRRQGLAHAMIDVSDGLGVDAFRLARESRTSLLLEAAALEKLAGGGLSVEELLGSGEDYALAAAVSPEQLERLRALQPSELPAWSVVGRFLEGPPRLWLRTNQGKIPYQPLGFDHFR